MSDQKVNILAKVDEVLSGKELQDPPRALLLVRLVQLSMALAPHLTERYWQQLQSISTKMPPDIQADIAGLRTTLEDSLPSNAKGFAAEMLAEIHTIKQLKDTEEIKRRLQDCEVQVKKRLMLSGKGIIWAALIDAWYPLDRITAIQLMKNVSGGIQENYITRWNKTKPFSEDEWKALAAAVGTGKIEKAVSSILDDNQQTLSLPEQLLKQAAAKVLNSMQQWTAPINQVEIAKTFGKYIRLLTLHASGPQAGQIPQLMEDLYVHIAKAGWLDSAWMMRFSLIETLLSIGMQQTNFIAALFTSDYVQRLASKTPAHLANFLWAEWGGTYCAEGETRQALADVMKKTNQDPVAEAWFLVALVKRGLGSHAMELAAESPNAQALLPRLRRCWICVHPETAKTKVSFQDMAGDPIGEFLVQGSAAERAAYLKTVTQAGKNPVPGAMWAGAGTEEEPEGLRGFWKKLAGNRKSNDEIVTEYLKLNPLYASYTVITRKEDQFRETLRVNGYGEYRYEKIDSAMLGALVIWGDQEPEQVHSVLQAMWQAIRPDDAILMTDWLRNAILSRCVNVFSADKTVLINNYLEWLKIELVQKGRQWQIGKQIFTIKYPPTSLLQFCVSAAATVGAYSVSRRDQILISGLEKFEATPPLVELAAQLYNSGKDLLALEPPVSLKPNLLPSWQDGIIKNALPAILQALIASVSNLK
ncbi:MAG: hypothetical protein Q8N39_11330 [Pelolinea sp.]|nr:hypothetical protein [Pelolinea sp.]